MLTGFAMLMGAGGEEGQIGWVRRAQARRPSYSSAAFRNNTADPTSSAAKNPFRITTGQGQTGASDPHPATSAITAIATNANAAPTIARAIPRGRKSATTAPI